MDIDSGIKNSLLGEVAFCVGFVVGIFLLVVTFWGIVAAIVNGFSSMSRLYDRLIYRKALLEKIDDLKYQLSQRSKHYRDNASSQVETEVEEPPSDSIANRESHPFL